MNIQMQVAEMLSLYPVKKPQTPLYDIQNLHNVNGFFDMNMLPKVNEVSSKIDAAELSSAHSKSKDVLLLTSSVSDIDYTVFSLSDLNLLSAVSKQQLELEKVKQDEASLVPLILALQQAQEQYGNIKIDQLPNNIQTDILNALQVRQDIQYSYLFSEDTTGSLLQKLEAQQVISTEVYNIFIPKRNIGDQSDLDRILDTNDFQSELLSGNEGRSNDTFVGMVDSIANNEQVSIVHLTQKDSVGVQSEKLNISSLQHQLHSKIHDIQKYTVKSDRVLLQLTPESLGSLDVYIKKNGSLIQIHIDIEKNDAKSSVEAVLHEIKERLQERSVQVEVSFSEKHQEEKREGNEQSRQQERQSQQQKQEKKQNEDTNMIFHGLLGGAENED
jgi:flagellar hook-length control protein FliK